MDDERREVGATVQKPGDYEGLVAEDEASLYEAGPTRRWLKVRQKGWTAAEDGWRRRISADAFNRATGMAVSSRATKPSRRDQGLSLGARGILGSSWCVNCRRFWRD